MTIIAVMSAVALLLSMMSIAEGVRRNSIRDIEEGNVDILISPHGDHSIYGIHEMVRNISGWNDVEGTSASLNMFGSLMPVANISGHIVPVGTIGILPRFSWDMMSKSDREKYSGWFNDTDDFFDDPHYANGTYSGPYTGEIILGDNMMKTFNISVGDTIMMAGAIGEPERSFHVVGEYDTGFTGGGMIGDMKIYVAIMRLSELQDLVAYRDIKVSDRADSMSISLDPMAGMDDFVSQLKKAYPDYADGIKTKDDLIVDAQEYSSVSSAFYQAIGSVALVISLLFVASIMIMSVYERTGEIGMMRAIGISRRTIFRGTFTEGLLLVVIGALLGLIPGYFGSVAFGNYMASSVGISESFTAFTPEMIIKALTEVIILGSLFTIYPSMKAARMNILDALKHTG